MGGWGVVWIKKNVYTVGVVRAFCTRILYEYKIYLFIYLFWWGGDTLTFTTMFVQIKLENCKNMELCYATQWTPPLESTYRELSFEWSHLWISLDGSGFRSFLGFVKFALCSERVNVQKCRVRLTHLDTCSCSFSCDKIVISVKWFGFSLTWC